MENSNTNGRLDRALLAGISTKAGLILTNCFVGGPAYSETIRLLLDSLAEDIHRLYDAEMKAGAVWMFRVLLQQVEANCSLNITALITWHYDEIAAQLRPKD